MSNIAKTFREEIGRIARRESRASLERTRKMLSQQRQEIASLKARVKLLERSASAVERDQPTTAASPVETSAKQVRFMPKGVASMRQRLGLSVADLAKLLSVSDQTIYNWERGLSKPRLEHQTKLFSLRQVGKRELQSFLAQSEASG
ncbi:MAG: helix-turn-helix domain-containing protein [Burkholderiaceae bacterium]|nr:helix-turn-helix domain-containing protein [Burkholderiaceae bacterium]